MTEMTGKDGRGRIVVGVDGSEASKGALLWAAHEAELTGASLDVVMVSEMPFRSYGRLIRLPDLDDAIEAGHRLHGAIGEVLGGSHLPRRAMDAIAELDYHRIGRSPCTRSTRCGQGS
jgi:nucleotide-binding universal stress UspA family protein